MEDAEGNVEGNGGFGAAGDSTTCICGACIAEGSGGGSHGFGALGMIADSLRKTLMLATTYLSCERLKKNSDASQKREPACRHLRI